MIEHASLIALCLAFMALMGLIYVALFMRSEADDADDKPRRDAERKSHLKRWEDRL